MVLRYRGLNDDFLQQDHAVDDARNMARRSSQLASMNELTRVPRYRGLTYTR